MLLTFFDFPAEHWKHLRTQRDRVAVRDGPAAPARDEGRGVAHEGAPDGLQAPRHGAGAGGDGSMARSSCRSSGPGIGFVDGVQQEGKVNRTRANAA